MYSPKVVVGGDVKHFKLAILAVVLSLGICSVADATYVGNDPANETDPSGEYQYSCETGSRIGCAMGFQTLQEKAVAKYQNALERLGGAITDMKSVAAQQAAGNKSAAVSGATAQTQSRFTHAFGPQSDMLGAMQFEQSAFQSALAGLRGSGPATNASGDTLTYMNGQSAPAAAVPSSHSILVNPSIWNNIDRGRTLWALVHEPLHGEDGWVDYRGPKGEKYMYQNVGGHSPRELSGPAALTNPDNAVCFVMDEC